MVSLSTNEMLKKMVENYGYGAYLFTYLDIDQIEKIQQIDPNFDQYVDDLMSDRIYDPQAKQILIQKYKNDRWNHLPKLYKTDLKEQWNMIKTITEHSLMDKVVEKIISDIKEKSFKQGKDLLFRKGDIFHLNYKDKDNELEAYFVFDEKFKNVYLRYKDEWEQIEPIPETFDILGSTPANFWNNFHIPGLTFYFPLNNIFDKIKWSKVKVKSQNYLLGEWNHKKKKSKIYIPISEKSTQEAKKLAIALQVRNMINFYPNDPENIIPSDASTLFGVLGDSSDFYEEEEEVDKD